MDSITLAAAAAALLSLLFQYIPGLNTWYEAQTSQIKALIMLALLLVVTAGSFALSCYGPYSYFECNEVGFWQAVEVLIAAIMANQGVHLLAKNFKKTAV